MTKSEVERIKPARNARIHVERVIHKTEIFMILKGIIQTNMMKHVNIMTFFNLHCFVQLEVKIYQILKSNCQTFL